MDGMHGMCRWRWRRRARTRTDGGAGGSSRQVRFNSGYLRYYAMHATATESATAVVSECAQLLEKSVGLPPSLPPSQSPPQEAPRQKEPKFPLIPLYLQGGGSVPLCVT